MAVAAAGTICRFLSRVSLKGMSTWSHRIICSSENVSPYLFVPDSIKRPSYAVSGVLPEESDDLHERLQTCVQDDEGIRGMREACRIAREVLNEAVSAAKPGVTTDDVDRVVHNAAIARGGYPSPLHYMGFPKSCCTSINNVVVHGIPDETILQYGDLLNVDVTVYYNGYHGDLNEMIIVGGECDDEGNRLCRVTKECLDAGIAVCRDGVPFSKIGHAISDHADKSNFGIVKDFVGHGIGKNFHCGPRVQHTRNNDDGIMRAGMTFTIEPMLTEGSPEVCIWEDKWTIATMDYGRSAQWEHTILIKSGDEAPEILTRRR